MHNTHNRVCTQIRTILDIIDTHDVKPLDRGNVIKWRALLETRLCHHVLYPPNPDASPIERIAAIERDEMTINFIGAIIPRLKDALVERTNTKDNHVN